VVAVEGWHLACVVNPFKEQCDLTFWATLTVPGDIHQNFTMCIHAGNCGGFSDSFCVTEDHYDPASHAYTMGVSWTGACGITDDKVFYVEVKNAAETPVSCRGYGLSLEMTWDGEIDGNCD
jgi:hypothetical protein